MTAQVVQDHQGSVAHLLEQLIVRDLAAGLVGGPKMVQQVGHHHKEGRPPLLDGGVADSRRQVRLAAAAGPAEHQPAARILGELMSRRHRLREPFLTARLSAAAAAHQVGKGQADERPQVAVALQSRQPLLFLLLQHAAAGEGTTEVRIIEGDILAHEARPPTERANALLDPLDGLSDG